MGLVSWLNLVFNSARNHDQSRSLVVLLAPKAGLAVLGAELFEKLNQTINEPATASDDVKPTLVLVLFQNSVEIGFQLVFMHSSLPQICVEPGATVESATPVASEVFAVTVAITMGKQKSEILMNAIENFDAVL
jgi:hypothetical protein